MDLRELFTGNLSRAAFATRFIKQLRSVHAGKLTFVNEQFAIQIGEKPESSWLFLAN